MYEVYIDVQFEDDINFDVATKLVIKSFCPSHTWRILFKLQQSSEVKERLAKIDFQVHKLISSHTMCLA